MGRARESPKDQRLPADRACHRLRLLWSRLLPCLRALSSLFPCPCPWGRRDSPAIERKYRKPGSPPSSVNPWRFRPQYESSRFQILLLFYLTLSFLLKCALGSISAVISGVRLPVDWLRFLFRPLPPLWPAGCFSRPQTALALGV